MGAKAMKTSSQGKSGQGIVQGIVQGSIQGSARTPAALALADGTVLKGFAFGKLFDCDNPAIGEVVFNTSMYGYQEIITDPSYAGQIVTFTAPHIGNVGCNADDFESEKTFAAGVIIRDLSPIVSNFRAELSLEQWLSSQGLMGLCGLDTRQLVSLLRDKGAQMGAMAAGSDICFDALKSAARNAPSMQGRDLVKDVTCRQPYTWSELPWEFCSATSGYRSVSQEALAGRPHCVAIDCGIKRNILRLLLAAGFRVTVVPSNVGAEDIRAVNPDCLFLSNGPGDPATLSYVVENVRHFAGRLPIFGICLGHQILGQVYGGRTYKLKFGHRGGNHPVKDMTTGKVEITVQNHGFAVDQKSLPKDVQVTHLNLNDQTVEGLAIPADKAFSIQYHPEASPGPHDAGYLFKRFFELVVS